MGMAGIESTSLAGRTNTLGMGDRTDLAQLGGISNEGAPNNGNFDQGVGSVQGRSTDGKVYSGQLIQRVYGTGYVRFYLKGGGDSHPLPARITSSAEAKVFARQQISKGIWSDLPLGDQNAFKGGARQKPSAPSAEASPPRTGSIPKSPNLDIGLGLIQGRAGDGKVHKGELIQRIYGTGYVRFYLKGTGRSHPLPAAITSSTEARVYARQQIAAGRWADMPVGDASAFKKAPSTAASGGKPPSDITPTTRPLPAQLRVDLGDPQPKLLFGIPGSPENEVARNRARNAGLVFEKDQRSVRIPNTREGGKIFAEMQFQTSGVSDSCKDNCRVIGLPNGRLPMPANASQKFLEGFNAAARRPNVD
jgi:hypothetical protein